MHRNYSKRICFEKSHKEGTGPGPDSMEKRILHMYQYDQNLGRNGVDRLRTCFVSVGWHSHCAGAIPPSTGIHNSGFFSTHVSTESPADKPPVIHTLMDLTSLAVFPEKRAGSIRKVMKELQYHARSAQECVWRVLCLLVFFNRQYHFPPSVHLTNTPL